MRHVSSTIFALSVAAVLGAGSLALTGCLDSLGVQGGSSQLSATFAGLDPKNPSAVQVLSPTGVQLSWTASSSYSSYNVFTSLSDAPVANTPFSSYTISGLKAATSYSFAVSGLKNDGTQDGTTSQVTKQTWAAFGGPSTATAVDAADVTLAWNYNAGPTFKVYYSTGAPPSLTQLQGPASTSTVSNTGMTVSGLQANTTYYFSVVAQYQDGTTSLPATQSSSGSQSALLSSGPLITVPQVTGPSSIQTATYASFTVSNAPATYVTKIYLDSVDPDTGGFNPANLLATVHGSGSATSTVPFPLAAGTYTTCPHCVSVKTLDQLTMGADFFEFPSISVTASVVSQVPYVTATTPASLTPLPIITAPKVSLGPKPSFQVSSPSGNYKTSLYYGATLLGAVQGTGTINAATALPQGKISVTPKVKDLVSGQSATMADIPITVRTIDAVPVVGPTKFTDPITGTAMNAGAAMQGTAVATGDFNCDGIPDLAVGAPYGAFQPPAADSGNLYESLYQTGGVIVYYGKSDHSGFDLAHPIVIPAPNQPNNHWGGMGDNIKSSQHFGVSLAAGNINADSSGGHSCDDLVVGASMDTETLSGSYTTGTFYVYYGYPGTGLQVTTPVYNTQDCPSSASSNCNTGKHQPANGTFVAPLASWVAIGDFNGDGYDDVAVSATAWNDTANQNPGGYIGGIYDNDGEVFVFYGSGNGLSNVYTRILMPASFAPPNCPPGGICYAEFGAGLAFGYVSDLYGGPYSGGTTHRKKDLLVTAPGLGYVFDIPGDPQPTADIVDANSRLVGGHYTAFQPAHCTNTPPAGWAWPLGRYCGFALTAADVNGDHYDDILVGMPLAYPPGGPYYAGGFLVYYGYNDGGGSSGVWATGTTPADNALTTCTTNGASKPCAPQAMYRPYGTDYWSSSQWYSNFGQFAANLGDTNGDGFADVGIGAPGYSHEANATQNASGEAFIYYGSSGGLVPSPASRINLNSLDGSLFGLAMVGGDFTTKTCSCTHSPCLATETCHDLAVTAPGESKTGSPVGISQGITHLFTNPGGGFSTSVAADTARTDPNALPVTAKMSTGGFNTARVVGDLNGDGFADVAAPVILQDFVQETWAVYAGQEPIYFAGTTYAVVVYYGSANGLITSPAPAMLPTCATCPTLIVGQPTNGAVTSFTSTFANYSTVVPLGDTNGDGFADLGTGGSGPYHGGYIEIFYGSSAGLITEPFPAASPSSPLNPLLISAGQAPSYYNILTNYWGAGDETINLCPYESTYGDFNGDGYSDLALAGMNPPENEVFVLYGSANGLVSHGALYDHNVGAADPYNQTTYTPTTISGVWPDAILQPQAICESNANGSWGGDCATAPFFVPVNYPGYSPMVLSVGDVDHDGTDDVVVANYADNYTIGATSYTTAGSVFIIYGDKTEGLSGKKWAKLEFDTEQQRTGYFRSIVPFDNKYVYDIPGPVAQGYDINGDGISDIVIGAPYERSGTVAGGYLGGGAAYVVYGLNGGYPQNLPSSCTVTSASQYNCTVQVSNVGAPDYAPNHVVTNSDQSCDPTSNNCNVLRFYPVATNLLNSNFGWGVLGVGDLTGDGFGEVAVAAPGTTPNNIYVFSGSQSGLLTSAVASASPACTNGACNPMVLAPPSDPTSTGWGPNMWYMVDGWSGAGDIDGDGTKDFLILSRNFNALDGSGYFLGGFYLFH